MDTTETHLYSHGHVDSHWEPVLDDEAHVSDPLIGKIISERYRVLERIGRGGFGAVYKVQHIRLDKTFALKVLFEHANQNPRMIKRFEREARATCRIGHDNIVEITDFARDRRMGYYYVMEYLVGETLCERLQKLGPIPAPRIIHIACQIADALAATHAKGIIHRDLKPDNIFLVRKRGEEDFVKVLDFGITAMGDLEEQVPRLTRHGMMLGTPAYMSPEQAEGKPPDHRADIYSLGVILYEMVTGSVPFKNAASLAVLEMHRSTPPVPPRSARPDLSISPGMEQAVLRALRKGVVQRYQTMREVYNDLVNLSQTVDMSSVVARRPAVLLDGPMTPNDDRETEEPDWIDEDLVLLEDSSPTPANETDPQEQATISRSNSVPAIPVSTETGDEIDATGLISDTGPHTFPPPIPGDENNLTVADEISPFVDQSVAAMPARTLELATLAPKKKAKRRGQKSIWQSPLIIVLMGFTLTMVVWAAISSFLPDDLAPAWPSESDSEPAPVVESPTKTARAEPSNGARAEAAVATTKTDEPAVGSVKQPEAGAEKPTESQPEADSATAGPAPAVMAQVGDIERRGVELSAGERRERAPIAITHPRLSIEVSIQSEPLGAVVSWSGNRLGKTPVTVKLPYGEQPLVLWLRLNGYVSTRRKLLPNTNATIVVKLRKKRAQQDYELYRNERRRDSDPYGLY